MKKWGVISEYCKLRLLSIVYEWKNNTIYLAGLNIWYNIVLLRSVIVEMLEIKFTFLLCWLFKFNIDWLYSISRFGVISQIYDSNITLLHYTKYNLQFTYNLQNLKLLHRLMLKCN